MAGIQEYIQIFFDELEVYEDILKGTSHKNKLRNKIITFLNNITEENAYKVYEQFFKAYWIGIQNRKNPFIELTQTMKNFEEKAGQLCDRQRDHYIHTIFVFIMGLSIFIQNKKY